MEAKPKRDRRSTVRAQNSTGLQAKPAAAKSGKNDRSQPKPPAMPLLVAGKEVLGRELTVLREGPNTAVWLPGCVKAFNEPEVLHQIVYNLPFPDVVKNDEFQPAEWLCLGKHRYVWNEKQSWPYKLANPTYSQRFTPQGTSAIGQRVRVWWPFMRKWYTGKVLEYDPATDHHKVLFTDGDRKTYRIPHEPVVWLDIPQLACDAAIKKTRAEEGDVPVPATVISNDENKPPDSSDCNDGEVNGKERVKSRKDRKDGAANGRKVMRTRAQAASAEKSKQSPAKGSKGSQSKKSQPIANKAAGTKKAEEPKKAASKKSEGVKKPAEKPAEIAPTEAAKPMPKSPQSSRVKSPDSRSVASKPKVTPKADVSAQKAGTAKTVAVAETKPPETQPAQNAPVDKPGKDDKEVAVNVKVACASKDKQCEMLQGAFNNLMRASPAHSRKRNRVQEAVNSASKQPDDNQPAKTRAVSKLSQGSARTPLRARQGLNGRRDSLLQHNMDSIKGSRVGVWWDDDKCYYKGKIIACDGYHRNITVRYDDNVKEKSRIDSLQFKWLLPRARTAGATDKVHAAFQALGALNARNPVGNSDEPQTGEPVDVPVKMEHREPSLGLHPSRPTPESPRCPDATPSQPAAVAAGCQLASASPTPVSPSHISNSAFTTAAQFQPLSQAQTSSMMMMARHMPSLATLPGLSAAHLLVGSAAGQHLASLVPNPSAAGLLPVIQAAAQQASLMGLASTTGQAQAPVQMLGSQGPPRTVAMQAAFTPSSSSVVSPAGAASYRKPQQETDKKESAKTSAEAATKAPQGAAAEGWKVSLKFRGNGQVFEGLVLRCNAKSGKCHVLWEDGEDEWLEANDPDLTWISDCKNRPKDGKAIKYLPSYSAGLPEGMAAPSCEELVGWRIAVYWPKEGKFYEGTVDVCDAELRSHTVQYCDGEERWETLSTEVFKYVLPPNVYPGGHGSRGHTEASDFEEDAQPHRPRKRSKGNHAEDSDDEGGPVRGRGLKNVSSNLNLRVSLGAQDKGIRRMLSGKGSLLLFDRDQGANPSLCSPMSPQGSQAFALHGLASRQDSRNPPACVKNISGLISSDGFRVGVKRVRVFLNDGDADARSPKAVRAQVEGGRSEINHKPVVAVNNLHQSEPSRYKMEALKAIRDRVDTATDNIRNSMPLEAEMADFPSMPSSIPSVPSLLCHVNSRVVLENQPCQKSNSLPDKPSATSNVAPLSLPKPLIPASEKQAVSSVEPKPAETESVDHLREPQLSSDILLTSSNPIIPESLTPPPSPFSGFKEETSAPIGLLCPELVSTLADEFQQENQNSMALPQTPSINFEAMIRAPSRTGSMGSNHNNSPGRLEPECRPPLDSQKDGPELVRSH